MLTLDPFIVSTFTSGNTIFSNRVEHNMCDVVQVKVGECVPADCRVAKIQSIALQVEQAALTGESVSVKKNTEKLGDKATML